MANYALTAALAAALATASGPVIAADAPQASTTGGGLEEIVVTSQRRTEKLMDVPMSITAFGQERLDQEGLRGVDDLTRVSPGVTFLRQGNSLTGNLNGAIQRPASHRVGEASRPWCGLAGSDDARAVCRSSWWLVVA